MDKIKCSVENCSHNSKGLCYADRVNIQGSAAKTKEHTACASFLERAVYSDLTNNTNDDGPCSCLFCKVNSCSHNSNNLCTLESIDVSPDTNRPNLYSDTSCYSFKLK